MTHRLENGCNVALEWFADNFIKSNADKCHLFVLGVNRNLQLLLQKNMKLYIISTQVS